MEDISFLIMRKSNLVTIPKVDDEFPPVPIPSFQMEIPGVCVALT